MWFREQPTPSTLYNNMENKPQKPNVPTPEELAKRAIRDRFSGYQLPMEILDDSGASYVVLKSLPNYFRAMPQDWTSKATAPPPSLRK